MQNAWQLQVQTFVSMRQIDADATTRLLDLMSEIGELSKVMLNENGYGKRAFAPNDAWRDEMGDVFFALVCLANETHVNLEEALNGALEKYRERLETQATPESGN